MSKVADVESGAALTCIGHRTAGGGAKTERTVRLDAAGDWLANMAHDMSGGHGAEPSATVRTQLFAAGALRRTCLSFRRQFTAID